MRRVTGKQLLLVVIVASLSSSLSFSLCTEAAAPSFPQTETAVLDEVLQAQVDMKAYINATEQYLQCISPRKRERRLNTIVAAMKSVTGEYNALVKGFKLRQTKQLYALN